MRQGGGTRRPGSGRFRAAAGSRPVTVDLAGRSTASTLMLGGTEVSYWDYAPAQRTAATRTIVMVHGFRGDHHGLERIVQALPQMRVVIADLPGFGQSAPLAPGRHTVEGYGTFLSLFLDALALGPDAVLLGHSFGSVIAAHFAATHPGRVHPLILVNPIAAPALEGAKGLMTKLAVFYYWAAAKLPAVLGNALLRSKAIVHVMSVAMAKTRDPDVLAFVHAQHRAYFSVFADRDMLLESFRASVSGTVGQVADRLTLPVLLVAGADDEIALLADQHRLLPQLPDGTLEVLDGVGHLIHYETPQPAAAAIAAFLERHPAP